MEKFLIRKRKLDDGNGSSVTQQKSRPSSSSCCTPPSILVSFNANSIKLRTERGEVKAVAAYMKRTGAQALLIQETRIKEEDRRAVEVAILAALRCVVRHEWTSQQPAGLP